MRSECIICGIDLIIPPYKPPLCPEHQGTDIPIDSKLCEFLEQEEPWEE